jgi:hypothetical protein
LNIYPIHSPPVLLRDVFSYVRGVATSVPLGSQYGARVSWEWQFIPWADGLIIWSIRTGDDFSRLVFAIVLSSSDYEEGEKARGGEGGVFHRVVFLLATWPYWILDSCPSLLIYPSLHPA